MNTRRRLAKREDYCIGRPKGFLCVSGVTDMYYECSYPHYEGWRHCSFGTECTVVGHHLSTPCKAPRREEEEEEEGRGAGTTEDSYGSKAGNNSSSASMESSLPGTNNKGGENVFEKLEWWHWLLIGVAVFLVLGIIVSFVIRFAIYFKRKKKRNDLELEEAKEKKEGMSPEATVLCMDAQRRQEREAENHGEEERQENVNESIISSSDSTSTLNSNTDSNPSSSTDKTNNTNESSKSNKVDRDLINTM